MLHCGRCARPAKEWRNRIDIHKEHLYHPRSSPAQAPGQPDRQDPMSFDQRKDAAEKKYAHDEELAFKASARRNKLLGLWAAEKLGKTGADAEAYAKSVIMSDFDEIGDDDVFRKVKADLDAASSGQSDHQIRRTMDELMATAIEQIKSGT
jgi:hypothetical protein